jgi:hypothetical protein
MSERASLELRVLSDGVLRANRALRDMPAAAGEAEKAAEKLAQRQAEAARKGQEAAERQAQRQTEASQRAAAAAEKAAAREAEAWNNALQKSIARYQKQEEAAKKAADRQVEIAEKAAKREADAWSDAIQKAKARADREGWGKDGILPIRPSLQRIEARLGEGSQASGVGAMLKGVGEGSLSSIAGMAGIAGLAGGAAAIGEKMTEGLSEGIHKVIEAAAEMDNLRARIEGVTGASDKADEKFEELEKMTLGKMPSTVRQVSEAFIYLENTGLDGSSRALKAYSNIAAQTGTAVGDVARAVQMATLGNYRSLREFGIKAKEEGDHINVTFRGMKTEVANTSTAIQEYFQRLGNTEFAGAAERQMETMGGAIKKVSDEWEQLANTVARTSLGGIIKSSIGAGATVVEMLNASVSALFDTIDRKYEDAKKKRSSLEMENLDAVMRTWAEPSVSRSELENAADTINEGRMSNADKALQKFQKFDDLLRKAKELGEEQAGGFTIDQLMEENQRQYQAEAGGKGEGKKNKQDRSQLEFMRELDQVDPLQKASTTFDKLQAGIDRFLEHGGAEWEKYTELNLARYGKDVAAFHHAQDQKLEAVKHSLLTQEALIEETYNKRKFDTLEATKPGKERDDILAGLQQQRQLALEARMEQLTSIGTGATKEQFSKARFNVVTSGFDPQQEEKMLEKIAEVEKKADAIRLAEQQKRKEEMFDEYKTDEYHFMQSQQRKLAGYREALAKGVIIQSEFDQLRRSLNEQTNRKMDEQNLQYMVNTGSATDAMMAHLATATKNWAGESSGAYRQMAAAQKAFAVFSATINMLQSISAASAAQPWMAKIPLMAQAAAQGAGIVAMISSKTFDTGGDIPYGSAGLVGEKNRAEIVMRPTMVQGPATVVGSSDTAKLLNGKGQQSQPVVNVRIVQASGDGKDYHGSSAGERVVVTTVARNPAFFRAVMRR